MSGFATPVTLVGILKQRYANGVVDDVPDNTWLQGRIAFDQQKKTGDYYNQPVVLTQEQGVTYYAANQSTLPSLNSRVPTITGNAQLRGTNHVISMGVSYEEASKAVQGPQAFVDSMGLIMDSGTRSLRSRIEIEMLYGQSTKQLGTFASSTTSGATATLTFSTGQWAVGFWTGKEGAQLNFYLSGALVVGATGAFTLTSVDITNRKITVTETVAGQAATLNTSIGSNADLVSVNYLGAFGVEMVGMQKMITNTGSLFGIDASVYSMWAGNTFTGTGALTFGQIMSANALPAQRGLQGKSTVLLPPTAWANLASDQASLRRYGDVDVKTARNGFNVIEFYSQTGELEIVAHNCVKNGDFFIVPLDRYKRVGSSDVVMSLPGMSDADILFNDPTYPGYIMRLYTDQALIGTSPSLNVYGTIGTPT